MFSDISVSWNPITYGVPIGGTFILQCNISGDYMNSSTRRWTEGNDQTPLIINGEVANRFKYEEHVNSYSDVLISNLLIKNFSTSDMETLYTCAYGIYEYTKLLDRNCHFYTSKLNFIKK